MTGYSVNLSGLEDCQQVIGSAASQFSGIPDMISQSASSSDFGSLPSSRQLAQITAEVSDAARSQIGAAGTFLKGTEQALDQALEGYLGAEKFAAYQAQSASDVSQHSLKIATGA